MNIYILFIFIYIADVLKKEWAKLKDNYRKTKSKREKMTRSGAGSKKPLPTCNYFAELSFLYDSVSNRSVESNIPSYVMSPHFQSMEDDKDNDNSNLSPSTSSLSSPINIATGSGISKQYSINSSADTEDVQLKKRRRISNDSTDLLLVKTLDKHLNKDTDPEIENDDNRLFCLSLVPTLKLLNPRKNALARIKIQQLLFDITYDES